MTGAATFCALVLLSTGLVWLAAEDVRRFEISPPAAALTGGGILALQLITATSPLPMLAVAGIAVAIAVIINRLRPAALGQGDITLFALIGLAAGPAGALASAITFGSAGLVTSLVFLRLRRKPLSSWRRHKFPAAPAGCAAIITGLLISLL
jgi:Flp pilus assembly protein protease CpaA